MDLSVNGGSQVPALVDTGSDGLVIPWQDIGWQTFSFPISGGIGSYGNGFDYFYLTFDMPVNFDNIVTTSATPVDVELFSFPTTFQDYFAGDDAQAILGIGPNAVGPGPSVVTTALPAGENQGIYLDEYHKVLEFGANPDASPAATIAGSPDAQLLVQIGTGAKQHGERADRFRWRLRRHPVVPCPRRHGR